MSPRVTLGRAPSKYSLTLSIDAISRRCTSRNTNVFSSLPIKTFTVTSLMVSDCSWLGLKMDCAEAGGELKELNCSTLPAKGSNDAADELTASSCLGCPWMSTASVPAKGRAGALIKGESYKKCNLKRGPVDCRSSQSSSPLSAPKQRFAGSEVKRFAARSFV